MEQLSLFPQYRVEDIRKQVIREFKRIDGEDYDEWLEVVRTEVDYRLSLIPRIRPKYHDITKDEQKELEKELDKIKFKPLILSKNTKKTKNVQKVIDNKNFCGKLKSIKR